jgi:hypothetical protein
MAMGELILQGTVAQRIFLLRGQKVMLSPHLAQLYRVEVRALIQAVRRNRERFPQDFCFQLTKREYQNLKSQFVISRWGGARRAIPYAFTEQGVAMLSSVLHSKRAIQVNIAIMRVFVKLRHMLSAHKRLAYKLQELESKVENHDKEIKSIFEAIRQLMAAPSAKKRVIKGFRA